jgi:hypothetical protein
MTLTIQHSEGTPHVRKIRPKLRDPGMVYGQKSELTQDFGSKDFA